FPPERTILSCSNNHSGDYGWNHFRNSYDMLADYGFVPIGRKDEPSVVLQGSVSITTATSWLNQRCLYVARMEEAGSHYDPQASFNILYPCWGHELRLHPGPNQIHSGMDLLRCWDMVIGYHSHCPQPVTAIETDRNR